MSNSIPNNASNGLSVPYWRLSGFYFFYFSILGAFVPYWGLYLESLNFSAKEIGIFSAIVMGTKIVAPNIWGWLADRTGRRLTIVRIGSFLACCSFALIFINKDFWFMAIVMMLYSFFWNAVLAQFEVITLGYMKDQPQNYGKVRVWGSIGFIAFVLVLGYIFDAYPIGHLPLYLFGLFVLLWFSSLTVPSIPTAESLLVHEQREGFWTICKNPSVLVFFFACFMMQIAHGPYYSFYSIYMEDYGYSKSAIGQLWMLGVLAEVVLFMVMHHLLVRYSLRFIMVFSLLIGTLRWLMIAACPESLWLMLLAQLLHAFTFGAFHAGSIELVRRFFGDGHAGQGQAIYSAVSFGLGGCIGSLLSGYYWDQNANAVFVVSSVACLIAAVVFYFGIREKTIGT